MKQIEISFFISFSRMCLPIVSSLFAQQQPRADDRITLANVLYGLHGSQRMQQQQQRTYTRIL